MVSRPRPRPLALTVALALAVALALSLVGGIVGCAKVPTMRLWRTEVLAPSPTGVNLAVWLHVDNPNGFDVQVRNVRAQMMLQGQQRAYHLPPIDFSPQVWLAANSRTPVWVPVVIPWNMLMPLVSEVPFQPYVPYTVTGFADVTATSTGKFERDAVQFSEVGKLSRQELMNAQASAPIPR